MSEYAARFDRLAASGIDVHGEATLVAAFAEPGSRILDAGCGTGRVALRLAELGFTAESNVVGIDVDPAMLAVARERGPSVRWYEQDLAAIDLAEEPPFDVIVAAGNVIPLLAAGTWETVIRRLAELLTPHGRLIAGFGLDPAHLPIPTAPVDLVSYDRWCSAAGLTLEDRYATWDRQPYAGGPYAVSVHARLAS